MKLAEALIIRADLQKKIAQSKNRMLLNAKIQDGDEVAEPIAQLFSEFNKASSALESLIKQINKTNASVPYRDGKIIDAIVERDCLSAKIKAYRELYEAAIVEREIFTRTEIKYIRCVDLSELQKKISSLSKEYRECDIKLQEANWHTDLAD